MIKKINLPPQTGFYIKRSKKRSQTFLKIAKTLINTENTALYRDGGSTPAVSMHKWL